MTFNFIQGCIEGSVDISTINDFIETWYKSNRKVDLYKFLGLTKEEYKLWLEYPHSLTLIIKNRKEMSDDRK
jgi:hypothetical protein